eukprot:GHRR01013588.1.p1 GENE.GHRR01013588.1~~GHRR01013588.1.p1  ORF type:complete len:380 (+),score=161.84 GHRR01013588.1:68-1141(+)
MGTEVASRKNPEVLRHSVEHKAAPAAAHDEPVMQVGLVAVPSHGNSDEDLSELELDEATDAPPVAVSQLPQYPAQVCESFATHRSSSLLLQHSRHLFDSCRRSFGKGRQSLCGSSMVKLVWSYPEGWQRQQRQQQQHDSSSSSGTFCVDREAASKGTWWCRCRTGPAPHWLHTLIKWYQAIMAHPVVNLPLGATIAGIVCAAVGPVRQLLVNELAPLHWLWLSLSWVGAASAPLATMQIGAELVQPPPVEYSMSVSPSVQWTSNAIAVVVKLIMVPLINIALLHHAGIARLAPEGDKVYQLLLLVQAAVPAAVTLLVVCSRCYPDVRPLSRILFWQYVASLFTLPPFLIWYMQMLQL